MKLSTALDAMTEILDINETEEELKNRNSGTVPDPVLCKATELLADFRTVLMAEMEQSQLPCFLDVDKQ